VFDADVDALFNVAIANFLVDYDAHGGAGHVVDDASLAVIDLVGHAFLYGAVGLNIDNITDSFDIVSSSSWFLNFRNCVLVWSDVRAHRNHPLLSVLPREGILRNLVS
jgi:hypothetical protein